MTRVFAALGRFAIRFRWAVVAAWVAATVLATAFLPSLSSVTSDSSTGYLPACSPSVQAARLAAPFQAADQTPVPVLVAGDDGPLTPADTAATGRLAARLAEVPAVRQVQNLGVSAGRQADQLLVLAWIDVSNPGPSEQLVDGLRRAIGVSALPPGLRAHLAGPPVTYHAESAFISPDGRTVRLAASLAAGDPNSDAALRQVPAIRAASAAAARAAGAIGYGVGGTLRSPTTSAGSPARTCCASSGRDHRHRAAARASAAQRGGAGVPDRLGAAHLPGRARRLRADLPGCAGRRWAAVLRAVPDVRVLLALGEDYNILVMARIREEADGCRCVRR